MYRLSITFIGIICQIVICTAFLHAPNNCSFRIHSAQKLSSSENSDETTIRVLASKENTIQAPEPSLENSKNKNGLPPIKQIKGVIFDMDGTLIKPCIDFADMRKRVYELADMDSLLKNEPEENRRGDVLKLCNDFSAEGQKLVKAVFGDIEEKALRDMELMEYVGDLCNFLDSEGKKRAVLTRNVGYSVDVMHDKLWKEHSAREFFPAVNRETEGRENKGPLPLKPAPDAILHICNVWGYTPDEVVMVGDSAADDITAASRAGCGGRVLLKYNGKSYDNDSGEGDAMTSAKRLEREPTLLVSNLGELLNIMKEKE